MQQWTTERLNQLVGIILLLLLVSLLISIFSGFAAGDANPFERDEIDEYLTDLNDNNATAVISAVFSIVVDSALGLAAVAGLYLLFRDRNRPLALLGLVCILASEAAAMMSDGARVATINIASDFVEGGPGDIAAGDAVILETGRALAIAGSVVAQVGFSALGIGILAFSAILAWAPDGQVTPPRWVGLLGVLGGVAGVLTWFIVVTDAAIAIFIIAGIAQWLWLLTLGGWLVIQPQQARA